MWFPHFFYTWRRLNYNNEQYFFPLQHMISSVTVKCFSCDVLTLLGCC